MTWQIIVWVAVLAAKCLTSLSSMIIWFLLYIFQCIQVFWKFNSNLASVTSNFGLGLRQFDGTAAQSFRFPPSWVAIHHSQKSLHGITWSTKLSQVKYLYMFKRRIFNPRLRESFALIYVISFVLLMPGQQGFNCKTKLTLAHAQSYLDIWFTKARFGWDNSCQVEIFGWHLFFAYCNHNMDSLNG